MTTQEQIDELYQEVCDILEDLDNQDNYENGNLERAMDNFCSSFDKGFGMKCAIKMTLDDQYYNHVEDLTVTELKQLIKILTKN